MQTAQVILCSIISKIKVGFRHSQLCEHGCYVESIKILADVLTTHITISRRFLIKAHLLPSVIASQGICQIVKIQLPSLDLSKKKKKSLQLFYYSHNYCPGRFYEKLHYCFKSAKRSLLMECMFRGTILYRVLCIKMP